MENQLISVFLLDSHHIEVNYVSENPNELKFFLTGDDVSYPLKKDSETSNNNVYKLVLSSENAIELGKLYHFKTNDDDESLLRTDRYVASKEFEELYSYEGRLGIKYSKTETSFKLWSPLSQKVSLKLEKNENNFVLIPMKRGDKGVFFVNVKEDLFNKKYSFIVSQNNIQKEILDPYGKAVNENSQYSVVIDINDIINLGTVKPETKIERASDAIIYELHIRDFTEGDKTVINSGKYLGILEKIDYLKKLGVTHVQILPVIDFGGVDDLTNDLYNWGYNPISFFALEGSYSNYPEDALARLVEFKALVNELHKADIRVIMDVVYNHLYDYITTDFQKNVPYYYFRRNGKRMANASGCGNDVASERKMVRRIICDSIRYFLEVFDVDGFRFDLMGLIDIDTSKEIVRIRDEVKKDALIYGEGWNMGVELKPEQKTSSDNSHKVPEIGFFNDRFRDIIKGSTFDHASPGYIMGNYNNHFDIDDVLFGCTMSNRYASMNQSINYVECHDNQTLFDKVSYFDESLETNLKRVKLANAITVLSFGVPFIHMGQEIGLSKELLDNTYNVKKINNMNWKLVEERSEMVNYISDLIKLRKQLHYDRISTINDIKDNVEITHHDNGLLTIRITDENFLLESFKTDLILINPTEENIVFDLDDDYSLFFASGGLVDKRIPVKSVILSGLSLTIFAK